MRRAIFLFAAVVALLAAFSPATAGSAKPHSPVIYEISPRFEGDSLADIEVTLRFTADADGVTTLALPGKSMGRTQLWRGLRDLGAEGGQITGEGATRTLTSKPRRKVALRYRLVSTIDHDPTSADGYPVTPWIRPSWFFLDGPSSLVTLPDRRDAPVVLKWKSWPAGFGHASNLEHARTTDPRRSVLIGGRDLRIVRSGPLSLAIRGRHAFTDAELAASLAVILKAERGFFGDDIAEPYLVAASSVAGGSDQAFSGTGKDGAFAMVASSGMTLEDLRPLLAHELFHAWNPLRLGNPVGPRGYWLSEGFTDFYARRLLLRAGLISPAGFVEAWNGTLRPYGVSPAKTMPGARAAEAFWTDPDAEKLPYQRGAMLAALWDWRLRQRGQSLDAVLRAQAEAFRSSPDAALTELFVATMAKAGVDVRADLARHLDDGAAIELPKDVFGPCGELETVTTPAFELGFEPVAGPDDLLTITHVKPGGAAYRAGLRDGMAVVRKVSGTNGDATRPYELVVRSADGAVSTVRFLPQGDGVARYQRLALDPAATADGKACQFG